MLQMHLKLLHSELQGLTGNACHSPDLDARDTAIQHLLLVPNQGQTDTPQADLNLEADSC